MALIYKVLKSTSEDLIDRINELASQEYVLDKLGIIRGSSPEQYAAIMRQGEPSPATSNIKVGWDSGTGDLYVEIPEGDESFVSAEQDPETGIIWITQEVK